MRLRIMPVDARTFRDISVRSGRKLFCLRLGINSGLSANALRRLCSESGCAIKGNATKRFCCETLLRHLEYSKEKTESILKNFKKNQPDEDEEEGDDDTAFDGILGVDAACEAALLSRLLNKLELKEQEAAPSGAGSAEASSKNDSSSRPPGSENRTSSVAPDWSLGDRGANEDVSLNDVVLPAGCQISLKRPPNASPYIQAFLPLNVHWKNKNSISRAFRPQTASGSVPSRASRSFEIAKAEVVAWLADWKDNAGSECTVSEPAPKRPRS